MERRRFLKSLGALTLGASGASLAAPERSAAQGTWPTRTITMVVPFPPGGQADLAARPVAAALEGISGQPVVVENRGGAGGAIGNAAVARAAPDGYTLLMTLSSLAVLPEAERLFGRQPAYEVDQLAPIARVLADPTVLAVPASAPWRKPARAGGGREEAARRHPLRLVGALRHAPCRDGDVRQRRRHQAPARALPGRRARPSRGCFRARSRRSPPRPAC